MESNHYLLRVQDNSDTRKVKKKRKIAPIENMPLCDFFFLSKLYFKKLPKIIDSGQICENEGLKPSIIIP